MREAMMPTYSPPELLPVRGQGSYIYDEEGNKYLDFMAGIAVNSFGHCHPYLVEALTKQANELWHTSNVFRIGNGERLAQRLAENSFAEHVFFANSGAEAVECAFKSARKYHHSNGATERMRIVSLKGAFHGRTISTVAACKVPAHCDGFFEGDLGFDQVEYGDLAALKAAVTDKTAAIIMEPVQGEGGIRPATQEYMQGIRDLCDATGTLLIHDSVQCGFGRTGKLFTYENYDIAPDIMTLAKGLGGGFPIGACLTNKKVGDAMIFGTHGSTFGGNPMATAVANAVLDLMHADGFLASVVERGQYLQDGLHKLIDRYPTVLESTSGLGLMIGLKCKVENTKLLLGARAKGLLLAKGGNNMVRMLPPLNISTAEADEALQKIADVCEELVAEA